MSAYIQKGRKTPQTRVYRKDLPPVIRSLGTKDPKLAKKLESFLARMREARRWDVLDLIVDRSFTIMEAYDYDSSGTLTAQVDQIYLARELAQREASEVDLSPLVDTLITNAKYVTQLRRYIPEGERFPVSKFTRGGISKFLRELKVIDRSGNLTTDDASPATKNRYKAAISVFAKKLIQNEVIETNPVNDVESEALPLRDLMFLEPHQIRALVEALPLPYRALEALMAGTGMELQACMRLQRRDINLDTRIIYARGTKTKYRTRYVEFTEDWAWSIFAAHVSMCLPGAPIFDFSNETALDHHNTTAKRLNLPKSTLHNHRHSYSVMWIRRGLLDRRDKQWLKNQLGHAPQSTQIDTVYGVYINAAKLTIEQEKRLGKQRSANA